MQNKALCDFNEWIRDNKEASDDVLGEFTVEMIDDKLRNLLSEASKTVSKEVIPNDTMANSLRDQMAKDLIANFKAMFSRGLWGWLRDGIEKKLASVGVNNRGKEVLAKMLATEFRYGYKEQAQAKDAAKDEDDADASEEEEANASEEEEADASEEEVADAAEGEEADASEGEEKRDDKAGDDKAGAGAKSANQKRKSLPEKMDSYLRTVKGLPKGDKKVLKDISRKPLHDLYAKYMPDSLAPIVPAPIDVGLSGKRKQSEDTEKPSPKRRKSGVDDDADYIPVETAKAVRPAAATLGQKIVFLRNLNRVAFVQDLFPGPQVKAWMRTFSPTMVAGTMYGFLKTRNGATRAKVVGDLKTMCSTVFKVLTKKFHLPTTIGIVKKWTTYADLTKRQLLLLPCMFPCLLGLPFTGQLAKNGMIPTVDTEIKPERDSQKEFWHRMWKGSMCTNGHKVYFHVYDSTHHTAFENGYRYTNLLRVSINMRSLAQLIDVALRREQCP